MYKTRLLILSLLFLIGSYVQAQNYNIVIKGGHVIDPKNNINEIMDVAVKDGKIALVAKNIDGKQAKQVVDATGLYVTPGLIDMHSHNFPWIRPGDPMPDGFTFRNGITTTVDAGSSGWKSFSTFKAETIDRSETRVLAFLNIVGEGFKGGAYEQNTGDMDAKLTSLVARRYKDYIVGVKVAHFEGSEWTPVDRAVEAGNKAGIPVMIDFGGATPPLPLEELLMKHLRPGDIFTHCFGELKSREAIVDIQTKKVKPFVWEAQKRGVIFDVGYGGISFAYSQAIPALKSGFLPNTISTDSNHSSINGSMKNLLSVLSKFLGMGMDLPKVITASTWKPAQVIHHEELGHLSVGAIADVAVLKVEDGKFGFYDYTGFKTEGSKRLACEMTILGGKIVYDLNGIATPAVIAQRSPSSSH